MGSTYSRVGGLIAAEGKHEFAPAKRRHKGKLMEHELGGNLDPVMKITGEGTLLISSGDQRIQLLSIGPMEGLYVRESSLFSFQSTISWENGKVTIAPEESIELVHLSGAGNVALASRKTPVIKEIVEGTPLKVKSNSIIGWQGKITPTVVPTVQEKAGAKGELSFVEFSGKGKVIIE